MAAGTTIKQLLGLKPTKFDWQATESAPINYPMRIIGGSLGYHDDSGSLYVPTGSSIDHGWGTGRSSHITGPTLKPLPKALTITFFSFTENQFYRGRFDLPYERILKMFQDGYESPRRKNRGDIITYNAAVVGVAPGGAVVVWLKGMDKTTEVFFGQAEKFEGKWSSLTSATHITREQYIQEVIQESLSPMTASGPDKNSPQTAAALAALKKNGVPFGLWNTYLTRYAWQPLFTGIELEDRLISDVKYFNGERDYLYYPLKPEIAAATRAVPRELHFSGGIPGAKPKSVKLFFNEAEILAAFQKLGTQNLPLKLEMRRDPERQAFFGPGKSAGVVDGANGFSIWLSNGKDAIELKRTEIKVYGA